MKTSVMKVHDMLSVLSVVGVEKRIGEVPGVESVTVNFAAGSATVRFDETRLSLADIRSDVRQSGSKDDAAMNGQGGQGGQDGDGSHAAPDSPPDAEPVTPKTPPAAARADAKPQAARPSAADAAPAANEPLPGKTGES